VGRAAGDRMSKNFRVSAAAHDREKREEREEGDALDDAASADEYAAKRVLLVAKVAAAVAGQPGLTLVSAEPESQEDETVDHLDDAPEQTAPEDLDEVPAPEDDRPDEDQAPPPHEPDEDELGAEVVETDDGPSPEGPTSAGATRTEVEVIDATRGTAAEEVKRQILDGWSFIHDEPDAIPALWGDGDRVVWPEGESLVIAGGQGVGKTTLAGQVVTALIGAGDSEVLDLPVSRVNRVLYLAMDRPRQAARSLRRQLGSAGQDQMARLAVWKGPPPVDLAKHTSALAGLAELANADVVVVDSLKDAALGLTDDEVGAGWNRARQLLLADGRNLMELHHIRKAPTGRGPDKAPSIGDIYGSTWITSGAGSVLLLSGDPDDAVVRLHHVKQPMEEVGPWNVAHHQTEGRLEIVDQVDVAELVARRGRVTVKDLATVLFDTPVPNRNQVEKARRKLDRLTARGVLTRTEMLPGNPTEYACSGGVE